LEELLPKPAKLKKVRHHPALPYRETGAFFDGLRLQKGIGARALELTVLTACRTGEVLGAQWTEIDFKARVWVVPPERMKNGKEHRIPLVDAALDILKKLRGLHPVLVFPGAREDKMLSSMSMLTVLRRMNRADLTVHGFRSTFRDWAAEMTQYPKGTGRAFVGAHRGERRRERLPRSDLFERPPRADAGLGRPGAQLFSRIPRKPRMPEVNRSLKSRMPQSRRGLVVLPENR
jgi:integrase